MCNFWTIQIEILHISVKLLLSWDDNFLSYKRLNLFFF